MLYDCFHAPLMQDLNFSATRKYLVAAASGAWKYEGKESFFRKELLISQQHGNKLILTASVPLKYSGEYNYSFRVYPRNFALTRRTDIVRLKPA